MTENAKKWLPWALVGACLLLVPCAFCAGWLIPRGQTPEMVKAGDKALAKPVSKPREEWGFQDIQDHLAANGVKTNRGFGGWRGKAGMWFEAGGTGKPIDVGTMASLEMRGFSDRPPDPEFIAMMDKAVTENATKEEKEAYAKQNAINAQHWCFFVEDRGTVAEAKKHVERLADVQQEPATAWSKYVIYGDGKRRAELKKLLP